MDSNRNESNIYLIDIERIQCTQLNRNNTIDINENNVIDVNSKEIEII